MNFSKDEHIEIDVFRFTDYRDVIKAQTEESGQGRGYQTLLAQAAGCKRSFLSQVIHSHVHLTLDHAAGLSAFWKFNEDETDWFMELVVLARAGSRFLKDISRRRMAKLKKKRENLAERLEVPRSVGREAQLNYYSAWYWAAIHILLCIPDYSTVPSISDRLKLPAELVKQTLISLEEMDLVSRSKSGSWRATEKDIHLPKSSNLTIINHINWRHRVIYNIQQGDEQAIHYSGVHALSRADFERIKDLLLETIQNARGIVNPSQEEELICLACDLFQV
jgi:uncharacterized protein (TIGR02147 family)